MALWPGRAADLGTNGWERRGRREESSVEKKVWLASSHKLFPDAISGRFRGIPSILFPPSFLSHCLPFHFTFWRLGAAEFPSSSDYSRARQEKKKRLSRWLFLLG